MSKFRKDSGQSLVIIALSMVVILGFVGLAVDLGFLRVKRRQMQMLADSAAIAGAAVVTSCGGTPNCVTLTTAATTAVTENGFAGPTLAKQAGGSCGGAISQTILVVAVNNPPCYLGANNPHAGNTGYVEVVVSEPSR